MSHLIVVAEVPPPEPEAEEVNEEPDEERPLLEGSRSQTRPGKREEFILTQTFHLLPDFTLSHRVRRHRQVRCSASVSSK